jgi:hypothetical protein
MPNCGISNNEKKNDSNSGTEKRPRPQSRLRIKSIKNGNSMFTLGRHASPKNAEVLKIPLIKQVSNELIAHSSKLSSHSFLFPILNKNTVRHRNMLAWFGCDFRQKFSEVLLDDCCLFGLESKKSFHGNKHSILPTGSVFQCNGLCIHRLLLSFEKFSGSGCADDVSPVEFSLNVGERLVELVDVVSRQIQLLTKLLALAMQSFSLSSVNHSLTDKYTNDAC